MDNNDDDIYGGDYVDGTDGSDVDDDDDDDDDMIAEVASMVVVGATLVLTTVMEEEGLFIERALYENNYQTDRTFVNILMNSDVHCHNLLRMNTECFGRLVDIFKSSGLLTGTIHCTVEEQLAIFLHTISHNQRNRCMIVYCKHSGETISQYFNKVLRAILKLVDCFIKPPSSNTPRQIRENDRWYPYFKFTFVLAGWEGSASDSRMLGDTLSNDARIICHPRKFYLADAGFPLLGNFITPFRKTKYHLSETRGRAPHTTKQLFNHRHSSARYIIERAFGVLKKRFPILTTEPMYSLEKQVDIVIACCCIHNFIRGVMPEDPYVVEVDSDIQRAAMAAAEAEVEQAVVGSTSRPREARLSRSEDGREGKIIRTQISTHMWNYYRS
ncbi:uncharacterized protein LOC143861336 [Tasmannia lanceolata]|uniref:uncharacterized protein LOC143861336 n=1 Tax=Tasmannia lanceolata TaxID=3420 RepID=UPI00406421DE